DHRRECARAGVTHRGRRLANRGAIGKTGKAVDSTQTCPPFGKAEAGFGAENAGQSAPAGAGLVGPAVEIVVNAAVVEQSAGDAQSARIARHRHVEPSFSSRGSPVRIKRAMIPPRPVSSKSA